MTPDEPTLSDDELLRYSRQIMLPEIDAAGQVQLKQASVLIVGVGGLGSPAALYLAASGVGRLTLCDPDRVELSNLQRQIAHDTASIGLPKAESASARASALNTTIDIDAINQGFDASLVDDHSVVLDCTDNFATRYAINDACFAAGVPVVSGAAIRWEGQLSVFDPRDATNACYRCLYPDASGEGLDCASNGVAAAAVGSIGVMQALEAVKLLTGAGDTLINRVLYADFLRMEFRTFKLTRATSCNHPASAGSSS